MPPSNVTGLITDVLRAELGGGGYGRAMPYGRRRQLVDRGIEEALSLGLQDLLASIETRTITDAVGVTTGSFFHHFANRAKFAEAVAHRFEELWRLRIDRVLRETRTVLEEASAERIRDAAAQEWDHLVGVDAGAGLQHLLWVARNAPLGEGSDLTGRQILRGAYQAFVDTVQPVYEASLENMGREMLPPFTGRDMTVMMNALAEGFQMMALVAPELVRHDLYVDAVAAAFIVITRPRTERADVADSELALLEADLNVRPPKARPRERVETWRHIADAAAPLFAERSPTDVRVAEVAEAAGVSPSTVYHQFGTVSAVAAAGWAQHVPELREISEVPLTAEEGPLLRIEQVLTRYVELIKANPGMAQALVSEVVREAGPAGTRGRQREIRDIVPLAPLVLHHVRELRVRGLLRRRIDSERLARSLIHLCTMQALLFPEESVERVVDETMAMVFDGSLVAPTG